MFRYVVWDANDNLVLLHTADYGLVMPYCTDAVSIKNLVKTLRQLFNYNEFDAIRYNLEDEEQAEDWGKVLAKVETACRWDKDHFVSR